MCCATDRLVLMIVKKLNLIQLACAWVTGELKDLNVIVLTFTQYCVCMYVCYYNSNQYSVWFMPAQVQISACKADPKNARTSRLV